MGVQWVYIFPNRVHSAGCIGLGCTVLQVVPAMAGIAHMAGTHLLHSPIDSVELGGKVGLGSCGQDTRITETASLCTSTTCLEHFV